MQKVPISSIKENPSNPRLIKDTKFKKLVESIKSFPQMLELRPIVVNEHDIILGGNMRYRASIEAGLTEIPVMKANDLTEEQQMEFIIKDNVGFGEWDWDILANEWDIKQLDDWGLDMVKYDWEDLDYIEEAEKKAVAEDKIVIVLDTENAKVKSEMTERLTNWINENYKGCEVK
jgi:ParB-like chromosome segregation protein Spo0J